MVAALRYYRHVRELCAAASRRWARTSLPSLTRAIRRPVAGSLNFQTATSHRVAFWNEARDRRVEDWRGGRGTAEELFRTSLAAQAPVPRSVHCSVSSPRPIKPDVRVSRIRLTARPVEKGYETAHTGRTLVPGRGVSVRYASKSPNIA